MAPVDAAIDRVAPRHKIFERTSVTVAGVAATAHVPNLSATDALLHTEISVSQLGYIFVNIAGDPVSGAVM